jgi:hypothetical protein
MLQRRRRSRRGHAFHPVEGYLKAFATGVRAGLAFLDYARDDETYRRGVSFGGRLPLRTAPTTEIYRSSVLSTAQRKSNPPRLMSPRPTKSAGKSKRC